MTQEDKAKAYDKVRKKIAIRFGSNVADEFFAEFEESEDEKIKKRITLCLEECVHSDVIRDYEKDECIAWLENIQYTIDHEKREGFHLGYKACLERQGKQKPTKWTEEEEAVLDALIRRLEGEDIHVSPHLAVECLESLKGRVLPKQEWSEEDEQHIDSLLKRLDGLCRNEFERTRFAISEDKDWLKSLKQRIEGE